jgi:HK97 family phage major capsid protein
VSGDAYNIELVLNAVGSVLSSEIQPNAACLNPADAIKMYKAKASTSGVRMDSDGAFADLPQTIWGLPLILSTAIPVGHALVGDFSLGATLFMRQGMTVLISDSDQDDWIRNAVKILAELRAALAVWLPAAFAYVTLSFAA